MTDRLALLGLSLLTMAGSRAPRPDKGATLSGSGEVTFVNTSGLVRVQEGEEAVMECVTRNLANNHLVSVVDIMFSWSLCIIENIRYLGR